MPLLATLKNETAECHAGLEKSMDVFHQVKSVPDYRALLAKFFTLYEPLEREMTRAIDWPAAGWDFAARLKTPLLRDDLLALNTTEAEWAAWPRCEDLPIPANLGEGVGVLYVLEGSTLGGQMISKQFSQTLGIRPETGGKFFAGYGAATGTQWRAFGQWAEARNIAAGGALEPAAVKAARETFNTFGRWLAR